MKRLLCALLMLVLLCGTVVPALAVEEAEPSFVKEKLKIEDGCLIELESTIAAVTENFQAMWVSEEDEQPIPPEKLSVHVNEDGRLEIVTQQNKYESCVFLPGSFLMADGSVNEEPISVKINEKISHYYSVNLEEGCLSECLVLPKSIKNNVKNIFVDGETLNFSVNEAVKGRLQIRYGDTVSECGDLTCTVSGEGEQSCEILLDGICVKKRSFRILPKAEADKIFRSDRFWRDTGAVFMYPAFPFYILIDGAIQGFANWGFLTVFMPVVGIVLQPLIILVSLGGGASAAFGEWKDTFQKLKAPYSWES